MESLYVNHIAELMSVAPWRVEHCVELIAEGATVPFISRYRKERTGGLDEAQVAEIKHYSCLTGPSGAPVPPLPRKRGWSLWLRLCLPAR